MAPRMVTRPRGTLARPGPHSSQPSLPVLSYCELSPLSALVLPQMHLLLLTLLSQTCEPPPLEPGTLHVSPDPLPLPDDSLSTSAPLPVLGANCSSSPQFPYCSFNHSFPAGSNLETHSGFFYLKIAFLSPCASPLTALSHWSVQPNFPEILPMTATPRPCLLLTPQSSLTWLLSTLVGQGHQCLGSCLKAVLRLLSQPPRPPSSSWLSCGFRDSFPRSPEAGEVRPRPWAPEQPWAQAPTA